MKKHELLKKAYDEYPAGTVLSESFNNQKTTFSGVYEFNESGWITDHEGYVLFDGMNWAEKTIKPVSKEISQETGEKLVEAMRPKYITWETTEAPKRVDIDQLKVLGYDQIKKENNELLTKNNELMSKQLKFDELTKEVENLLERNGGILNENKRLTKVSYAFQEQSNELIAEKSTLKEALRAALKGVEELASENAKLQISRSDLRDKLNGIVASAVESETEVRYLKEKLAQIEKQAADLDEYTEAMKADYVGPETKDFKPVGCVGLNDADPELSFKIPAVSLSKPGEGTFLGKRVAITKDGTLLSEDGDTLVNGIMVYSVIFNESAAEWQMLVPAFPYKSGYVPKDTEKLFRYSELAGKWIKKANDRMKGIETYESIKDSGNIVVELENENFIFSKNMIYIPGFEGYLVNDQFIQLIKAWAEVSPNFEITIKEKK